MNAKVKIVGGARETTSTVRDGLDVDVVVVDGETSCSGDVTMVPDARRGYVRAGNAWLSQGLAFFLDTKPHERAEILEEIESEASRACARWKKPAKENAYVDRAISVARDVARFRDSGDVVMAEQAIRTFASLCGRSDGDGKFICAPTLEQAIEWAAQRRTG